MQADAGRIAAAAVAANESANRPTGSTSVKLCVRDTSAGAWRQLLDTPPGRTFLCDVSMAHIYVPLDCEGLGELLHFVNERARKAVLCVGVHTDPDARPEEVDACDLRLAQAVRGLPAVNAGLCVSTMYMWEAGNDRLPRTVEACGEKGLRCIRC